MKEDRDDPSEEGKGEAIATCNAAIVRLAEARVHELRVSVGPTIHATRKRNLRCRQKLGAYWEYNTLTSASAYRRCISTSEEYQP